jgi:hypothetical protein
MDFAVVFFARALPTAAWQDGASQFTSTVEPPDHLNLMFTSTVEPPDHLQLVNLMFTFSVEPPDHF